ncbi:MFS transporter [Brevibacillus sp. H7]|uniref:MFS transporter n=1 Tax=Brevibacillus sp. H7 TaxID=3349138 RepID=UPI00382AAC14
MTSPSQAGLFRNTFIRSILLSGVFLQIGIWVRNFAILLFVMEQTNNDPFAVSLISVAEFAPIFLFSFVGGTFADRWRPKRTMVWCDVLSALSVFVVLLTLLAGTWKAVFFATLVSAILSQFSQPSAMKLFKQHVPEEQLQSGMAMFQTLMAIFMIIGPILGTFVYQSFGIHTAIGVMGVAFLLSAGVLTFLPADDKEAKDKTDSSFWQELIDGFRYVWARPMLRSLGAVFAIAGLAVGLMQPLVVFIVMERLGLPKEYVQWLMMVNGAAMLIGGGLVVGISKKVSPQKLLALGMLASAVSVCGIGLSTNLWLTLAFEFVSGLFFPCIHIGVNTMILQASEEAYVGRVNGVLNPLFMGMMVLAISTAGWLKAALSLVTVFEAAGLLFLLGMFVLIPLFKMKPTAAEQT